MLVYNWTEEFILPTELIDSLSKILVLMTTLTRVEVDDDNDDDVNSEISLALSFTEMKFSWRITV